MVEILEIESYKCYYDIICRKEKEDSGRLHPARKSPNIGESQDVKYNSNNKYLWIIAQRKE